MTFEPTKIPLHLLTSILRHAAIRDADKALFEGNVIIVFMGHRMTYIMTERNEPPTFSFMRKLFSWDQINDFMFIQD